MRLLLHTCCAPCATHCIRVLQQAGHDITLFFSNANIAPQDEFLKRQEAVQLLADRWKLPLLIDTPDHADWLRQAAKGFEREREKGARCDRCFRYSLSRTYKAMLEGGFDVFTTSLSVSPFKHTPTLFRIGRELDAKRFLAVNFKADDGYTHSLQLTAELDLYRQSYCGCEFSIHPYEA